MGTSVEDAIRLQKFRLLSFITQTLERGNIELAQQALNGVEYYANEALSWFEAMKQGSEAVKQESEAINQGSKSKLEGFEAKLNEVKEKVKSKLEGFEEKLNEVKKKVNQWRQVLSDIRGNRGKLEQVIKELDEESSSISGFLKQINDLMNEISEKIKESGEAEWGKLVKELRKLYNLREKIEWLKASLGLARKWFETIKEEIEAKKGRWRRRPPAPR